jgi:hypothetical protein
MLKQLKHLTCFACAIFILCKPLEERMILMLCSVQISNYVVNFYVNNIFLYKLDPKNS